MKKRKPFHSNMYFFLFLPLAICCLTTKKFLYLNICMRNEKYEKNMRISHISPLCGHINRTILSSFFFVSKQIIYVSIFLIVNPRLFSILKHRTNKHNIDMIMWKQKYFYFLRLSSKKIHISTCVWNIIERTQRNGWLKQVVKDLHIT